METVENALEKLQYGLRQRFLPVLFDEAASLDGTGDIVARVKLPDISGIIETLKAFMDHIAYCRGLQAELTRIIKELRGMTPWWSAEADTLRDDIRALKRTIHFECAGIIG